jgi:WD40 repeat protein
MVITRLQRAALCVSWAPDDTKFAIGSGTKSICVCTYQKENNWWAGKVIRKAHDSSVVCVAWHPANVRLATGSTDGYCRIFYADTSGKPPTLRYIAHVADHALCPVVNDVVMPPATEQAELGAVCAGRTGQRHRKFGELLAALNLNCWVNGIAWDPEGKLLSAAGQDACIHTWNPEHGGVEPLTHGVPAWLTLGCIRSFQILVSSPPWLQGCICRCKCL